MVTNSHSSGFIHCLLEKHSDHNQVMFPKKNLLNILQWVRLENMSSVSGLIFCIKSVHPGYTLNSFRRRVLFYAQKLYSIKMKSVW